MSGNHLRAEDGRIAKWDNLKFLMILFVVIGHTIYYFYGSSDVGKGSYLFLYTFHMPVFVFITGLFAKRKIQQYRCEIIIQYLFIYLFMKFLEVVGKILTQSKGLGIHHLWANGGTIKFRLFWSDGPEWYALAMAVFFLLTMLLKDFNRLSVFLIALFVGCIGGLDSHMGNHFASMRILTFYPVFLAGYYIDRSFFEQRSSGVLRLVLERIASGIVLSLVLLLSMLQVRTLWPYINFFKAKTSYMNLKINDVPLGIRGILLRLGCYLLWALLVWSVVTLCPGKARLYTWLGSRTQAVFIWHKLILVILFEALGGKALLMTHIPHFYLAAGICAASIIAVVSAYLPMIEIGKRLTAFGASAFPKRNEEATQEEQERERVM